jgi:hypothetical protein
MNMFARVIATSAFLLAASFPAFAAESVAPDELASLQAAMQSHIDQLSVDGALLHLDPATGKVRKVFPAKAHPKIMKVGSYYYLCADFRDADGKDLMVNFYAVNDSGRYVFFYTDFTGDEELEHKVEKNAKVASN